MAYARVKIIKLKKMMCLMKDVLKKLFKFLSSVKLAIPIMLILLVCSVIGTLYESQFNAEYAALKVYKTPWFLAILLLLWINILFAALSRLPWKKRHIGFLITHLGMLTLLFGSFLTMIWGIDGSMQVYEGDQSNLVFLSQNVLEVDGQQFPIKRSLDKEYLGDLSISPVQMRLGEYLPFVETAEQRFSRGLNLNFRLKSQFFDVTQTLNSEMNKELKMGPASFKLVDEIQDSNESVKVVKNKITKDQLFVKNAEGNIVQKFDFSKKRTFKIKDVSIKIKNYFKNAIIVNNKIEEGDEGNINPVLELEISRGKESLREIVYQNIPEFSLNPNGFFGYTFAFESNLSSVTPPPMTSGMPAGHPQIGGARASNEVLFKVVANNQIEVALFKNGSFVEKKRLNSNDVFQTPWMGMELTFLGLEEAAHSNNVPKMAIPKEKSDLPPSALEIITEDGVRHWLFENSEQYLLNGDQQLLVYYGKQRLKLPFDIQLEKFEKKDYPGSQQAMNYKSYVKVNGSLKVDEIYMNEPLKYGGYTFYQSSYQIQPNAPALSIFSVNKDPGRVLKYLGSLILCAGIIIFTIQHSRRFRQKNVNEGTPL
ncbi:MAG: hypothetical protein COW00_14580 [Bdellovibrio sp. CG12_big_fil_rev_8_21_14_0_65_39_13]|nr:MAG: hypothetical protein COW78_07675 [Bdellovibrio sp. CG22_combo_CG10-13_8_21_14_all_39_27]PIQ58838.1 MAG: hypothetical protein COW00_14580 [Bdellovibrio sp. CG12_big_fil_rev_8_21_14_0_65_39_13]PIR35484.1 MAG: hypothetical protein COV37_08370 [Bdellovibrio sp. CG11_big_fil_rev_8_21_14_0_20_39_38]